MTRDAAARGRVCCDAVAPARAVRKDCVTGDKERKTGRKRAKDRPSAVSARVVKRESLKG
ncbi:MAG TPA: hypothetical protein VFP65_22075 [Anaeromyxobacteraceae bacterium]|nr:hypothetical protein [Anaeromyxobacteraceae bacterium]